MPVKTSVSLVFLFSFAIVFQAGLCLENYTRNCFQQNPNNISGDSIKHQVFFAGNLAGDHVSLARFSQLAGMPDVPIIMLGNTLPPVELDKDTDAYDILEETLGDEIKKLRDITKKAYYIPGNYEWFDGRSHTVDGVRSAEKFIQEFSEDKNRFRPSKGCGEPDKIEVSDQLLILLIDSQWMMQGDSNDERKKSSCEIDNNFELILALKEIIGDNKYKQIVIASHHPLYSAGKLGGNFRLRDHLLPVPILGSIISGIRKLAVDDQSIGHPEYEAYRAALKSVLSNCDNCIILSSHENNLQYHAEDNNHFFTTGTSVETDYVVKSRDGFALGENGYGRLVQTTSNAFIVELYSMGSKDPVFQKRFAPKIKTRSPSKIDVISSQLHHGDSLRMKASEIYGEKKFLRGNFYRKAWSTEVDVPVVFLDSLYGGLRPVQQGGGFQTSSLRLENENGQQWVMRSINKDVEKVIPPALRGTFAQNMVQDGIAASHPYGAFAIPFLAEKAGIYHANPQLVYLPYQQTLGIYNADFGNRLYLFEERPGGNASKFEDYGFPEETVNTIELIEELEKSNKHKVDQQAVLRARLFDIWIGDWDRHDDQWRWGVYEKDDIKIYRPIPRDRDQVFFKNDGVLDYLVSRPYFNPGLRKFDHTIDFLPGLIYNARYFDRSFLNALYREDFIKTAEDLVQWLDNETIERAFETWPQEIRKIDKEEIVSKLKSRREDLVKYAIEFHDFVNREVDVPGTNDQDIFEIQIYKDSLRLDVYHEKKTPKHHIYSRTFESSTTKELRLFGLERDDSFIIAGQAKNDITLRIIGGSGDDAVVNESSTLPVVYDRPKGMEIESGPIRSEIADINGVNSYDRKDWKQNRFWQFPLPSFYTDEGPGLSYNIWWKNHGFRKQPFKSDHKLTLALYAKNRAFNVSYSAYFPEAVSGFDLALDTEFRGPSFTQFFYGFGNEYVDYEAIYPGVADAEDQRFHIVKGTRLLVSPSLVRRLNNSSSFIIKPVLEYLDLKNEDKDPRYYLFEESGISEENLESKFYPAIELAFKSQSLDNPAFPTRGFSFEVSSRFRYNLSDSNYKNLNLNSRLSAYIPFHPKKNLVLASHLGFSHLIGTAEFFHLNYLARPNRLRGFRTNRFSGETIAFHVSDLRINLARSRGELPSVFGLILSFDYGRAWYEGDLGDHNTWHSNYGAGFFFAPLDLLGFKFAYYKSPNEYQLSIAGSLSF